MSATVTPRRPLPTVMVADAAVSAVSGSMLVLAAVPLGGWFTLAPTLLAVVGALVVVHAVILWWTGRRPDLVRAGARYAVVANLAWVVGAVVVLAAGVLTVPAAVALGAISIVVGAFGIAQWWLMR